MEIVTDERVRTRRPRRVGPTHRIILNFPPALAEQIRELASRERRPMSTQIQVLVERALAADADLVAA